MALVFTNGCFDVIHIGHVRLLAYCRELAGHDGKVIVGLNTDASVRRLKGLTRPINTIYDRLSLLQAIKYVDCVLSFDDDTPLELIKQVKPDIIVKGGDYEPEDVVGFGLAEVRIFNYIEGYSTTKILQDLGDR